MGERYKTALERAADAITEQQSLTAHPAPGEETMADPNQCDGCMSGWPVTDGIHHNPDNRLDLIACTKGRYIAPPREEIASRWDKYHVSPADLLRADAWDEGRYGRSVNEPPGAQAARVARVEAAIAVIENDVHALLAALTAAEAARDQAVKEREWLNTNIRSISWYESDVRFYFYDLAGRCSRVYDSLAALLTAEMAREGHNDAR